MHLWLLIGIPPLAALLAALCRSPRWVLRAMCAGVFAAAAVGIHAIGRVVAGGPLAAAGGWLRMDALSAFNLAVMFLVYSLSSVYACAYFRDEIEEGGMSIGQARTFAALWLTSMAAMTLVLISNNLGIMWVGIEATTLLTAFLICVHVTRESLEAMWKYIVICSVGVAFAFMGTLLMAAAVRSVGLSPRESLLWTRLVENAALLHPSLVKAAFIFLLVGYGTKAGLAPMHSWLPDAHSQAPAPVSAIFSGFMLNTALYCIMRYIPIVEGATGHNGWSLGLMTLLGLFSIVLAAIFILFQRDVKRFLAYSSVEHMGIIALGIGLGGLGTFAALFHTINHSISKSVAFFSAGRLGQILGTHDMEKMPGALKVSRLWGAGILGGVLSLIGMAPFAVFMSEFQILKAAVDRGAIVTLVFFLGGTCIVFVGALRHVIRLVWGNPEPPRPPVRARILEGLVVIIPLLVVLALGLWMPACLRKFILDAASIVGGREMVRSGL